MHFPEALVNVPGHANQVELLAGELCLDFVNTVEPRVRPRPGELSRNYLTCYQDLIAWSLRMGVLFEEAARHLLTEAEKHPKRAWAALDQAVQLREVIYRIFLAIARHQEVSALDLDALSVVFAQAMHHARLRASGNAFALTWVEQPTNLLRPLWPITHSAVELLVQGEKQRIKECARGGEGCGWLFYDTSKNSSRRWCSMRGCGSQAKERRRGQRKRSSPHLAG
jgi:predicted RNA-binding Zn ribbon-like protein